MTPAYAENLLSENPSIGKTLVSYHENIDEPLAAILTLNTIAHTVGAIGVGAQATAIWGASIISTVLIPVLMTLGILILSEIIPKTLGAVYWKSLAVPSIKVLRVIIAGLWPLVALSQRITRLLTQGKRPEVLNRSDFTAMADLGVKKGVINHQESSLLRNLIKFDALLAEDIMTPRTVVVAAPEEQSLAKFHQDNPNLQFSRVPLYSDSIDQVTGYFLRDDLLASLIDGNDDSLLSSIRKDLPVVKRDTALLNLFEQLIRENSHLALVVDDFGGTAGVVSMEDAIETLLGMEIMDEADVESNMQAVARSQWEVRAKKIGLLD